MACQSRNNNNKSASHLTRFSARFALVDFVFVLLFFVVVAVDVVVLLMFLAVQRLLLLIILGLVSMVGSLGGIIELILLKQTVSINTAIMQF